MCQPRYGGAGCGRIHFSLGQARTHSLWLLLIILSLDVLNEPDDSYPTHETKKAKKAKNITDPSEGIGAFFSKPPAPAVDSGEDVVMKDGGSVVASIESTNK